MSDQWAFALSVGEADVALAACRLLYDMTSDMKEFEGTRLRAYELGERLRLALAAHVGDVMARTAGTETTR